MSLNSTTKPGFLRDLPRTGRAGTPHRGARALFASHGVYRYCPNVNADPVADPASDFPDEGSSRPPDAEQFDDGRRTAFCASVLNSNSFVPPLPKLPGRANAANPPAPPVATDRSGWESTDCGGSAVSFDATAELGAATVCLAGTGNGDVGAAVLARPGFDGFVPGSSMSGRFELFLLTAEEDCEDRG